MTTSILFTLVTVCAITKCFAAWQENVRPKMYVQLGAEDDVHHFYGDDTHTDYFRLLLRDGESLLVGGRNLVYNVSLSDLSERQRLVWFSNEADVNMCVMKGKDEIEPCPVDEVCEVRTTSCAGPVTISFNYIRLHIAIAVEIVLSTKFGRLKDEFCSIFGPNVYIPIIHRREIT